MIKIAVCDDENMFALSFKTKLRDGFRKVLKQEIIVDTFDDANALLYKMKNTAYDVVFLDIEMPGVNGLEAAGWIKKTAPARSLCLQPTVTTWCLTRCA